MASMVTTAPSMRFSKFAQLRDWRAISVDSSLTFEQPDSTRALARGAQQAEITWQGRGGLLAGSGCTVFAIQWRSPRPCVRQPSPPMAQIEGGHAYRVELGDEHAQLVVRGRAAWRRSKSAAGKDSLAPAAGSATPCRATVAAPARRPSPARDLEALAPSSTSRRASTVTFRLLPEARQVLEMRSREAVPSAPRPPRPLEIIRLSRSSSRIWITTDCGTLLRRQGLSTRKFRSMALDVGHRGSRALRS